MRRGIATLLVLVAASAALFASAATARAPEPRPGAVSARVLRAPVLPNGRINVRAALVHNAVIARRELRGQTTNPGRRGNDTAPHTEPTG